MDMLTNNSRTVISRGKEMKKIIKEVEDYISLTRKKQKPQREINDPNIW